MPSHRSDTRCGPKCEERLNTTKTPSNDAGAALSAFVDARFSAIKALERNRGCEPLLITQQQAEDAIYSTELGGFYRPGQSEPAVLRSEEIVTYVDHRTNLGKRVAVRELVAVDERGRYWALAAADDVGNEAIQRHLSRIETSKEPA